ncbi:MAG: O-methyltransferase [Bacteroidales bacterium]|nr:O-methyltransferase [Bacteroidales bacterium]
MIPQEIEEYAERHTTPEPGFLAEIARETHLTQVYPQMLSGHLQGTLLRMLSAMLNPSRILEIGTFTGYSAISLALGCSNPEGLVHTIEVNPEFEEIINRAIHKAGMESRIRLHLGDALGIIPGLDEIWDLVFIDANKSGYLDYYQLVFPRVRPGGFILADNVLWDSKVIGHSVKNDKDTEGIIRFNEFVTHDERVDHLLLPFRDGLMIIRKK